MIERDIPNSSVTQMLLIHDVMSRGKIANPAIRATDLIGVGI
ncbi:hypothetical protein THF1C08_10490 [Vibrio jasicida]|uniref:Uncharacterized protein n=1 Tax=Vibrio jasicida TaxID=766224 RepID=A0AAU9QG19_9VIBR|nr:hypothetical protein THF1C08_10490 [Vibrio jasicida]CAH1566537.1 hypothetical protein THF1A12_10492 [Vibrio jasicida]